MPVQPSKGSIRQTPVPEARASNAEPTDPKTRTNRKKKHYAAVDFKREKRVFTAFASIDPTGYFQWPVIAPKASDCKPVTQRAVINRVPRTTRLLRNAARADL